MALLHGGAAPAVVGHAGHEDPRAVEVAHQHQRDVRTGRLGVLRDVGEELADGEVDVALDLGREHQGLGQVDVERHGDGRPGGEGLEGRHEPAVEEDGRGEPARQRAQLLEGVVRVLRGLGDERAGALRIRVQRALGGREVHAEAHEPLLRSVVQVALDLSERLALGRHGSGAGLLEALHAALEGVGLEAAEERVVGPVVGEHGAARPEREQHDGQDHGHDAEHGREREGASRVVAVVGEHLLEAPAVAEDRDAAGDRPEEPGDQQGARAERHERHQRIDDDRVQQVQPVVRVRDGREDPHGAVLLPPGRPVDRADGAGLGPPDPHPLDRAQPARREQRDEERDGREQPGRGPQERVEEAVDRGGEREVDGGEQQRGEGEVPEVAREVAPGVGVEGAAADGGRRCAGALIRVGSVVGVRGCGGEVFGWHGRRFGLGGGRCLVHDPSLARRRCGSHPARSRIRGGVSPTPGGDGAGDE